MFKSILLLDNYDSFTYNLLHYLEMVSDREVVVFRNDEISLDAINGYDEIVLSPGPGLPETAGLLLPLIVKYASTKKILGVCLGLQAIALAFGGTLVPLETVMHGLARKVNVLQKEEKLFKGIPSPFMAGRYHSWVANQNTLPNCLTVTANDDMGNIMALRHNLYNVCGVQFHPESILTPCGHQLIKNWLTL